MKSTDTLPAGYRELLKIDLQQNKRLLLLVNGLSLLILLLFLIPVCFFVPLATLFEGLADGRVWPTLLRLGVLLLSLVLYVILHELVHGLFIRIFSGKRARFGFTGMYAFAGSDCYFAKAPYLIIALAPVILLGAALALLLLHVPPAWFWVVYIIELNNLAGASGDLYVTCRLLKLPKDILVRDSGTAMTVFSPATDI